MKIKTITCHNVYNYGASLQAHALLFHLSELGHEVEVIDYMPDYIRKHVSIWDIGPRWKRNIITRLAYYCYVVPQRLSQKESRNRFDSFTNEHLRLTRRYNSIAELCEDIPDADVFFCGSDQIWNPTINNGLDPAFYLDFASDKSVKASYAASFSVSTLNDQDCGFIAGMLKKLDYISVREKTGLSIIKSLKIGKDAVNVLDPVFLPPLEHWISMTYTPTIRDYILVYDQEDSKTIKEIALKLSQKTHKKIIAFKGLHGRRYADIKIRQSGPIDFISIIAHADYVVTNSFHCSAFSIIFSRDFYVVPRDHQKVNSRMADLLDALNIQGHMVNSADTLDDGITGIDYEAVNEKLSSLRESSYNYIEMVLSNAQHRASKK